MRTCHSLRYIMDRSCLDILPNIYPSSRLTNIPVRSHHILNHINCSRYTWMSAGRQCLQRFHSRSVLLQVRGQLLHSHNISRSLSSSITTSKSLNSSITTSKSLNSNNKFLNSTSMNRSSSNNHNHNNRNNNN